MTGSHPGLAELTEDQRRLAMTRYAVLRPHVEGGVPLPRVAAEAGSAVEMRAYPSERPMTPKL